MTKQELKNHAQEEIRDAENYFQMAEECSDMELKHGLCDMAKDEMHHAAMLMGMSTMM